MRAVKITHRNHVGMIVIWLVWLNLKWKIIFALVWMRCNHEIKRLDIVHE